MSKSDDLHRLIRSLSPSEKRYIKVMARKDEADAKYLRLMDAIEAQPEYDEAAFVNRYAKEGFIKFLAAEKKKLHSIILKAMRAFHADASVDNQLHDLLQDEVFLRSKGLVAQRRKVLEKAKELALRHDKLVVLYQILEREYALVLESTPKDLVDECNALLETKETTMARLNELHRITVAKEEAFLAIRSGMDFKKAENIQFMDGLLDRTRLRHPEHALTKQSRVQAHSLRALIHRSKGDFPAAKAEYEAIADLYMADPDMQADNGLGYKIALGNYLVYANSARDYTRFEEVLAVLKALPPTNFYEDGELFQNVYFIEHLYYMNHDRWADAERLVPDIMAGLEQYRGKVNKAREMTFLYNILIMYFLTHKYKEALKYADLLMAERTDVRQDVQVATRIFHLICHYELGHADLMESLTRSVYRYLMGQQRLHEFERTIIKFLEESPFEFNDSAELTSWSGLRSDFIRLRNENEGVSIAGIEELLQWLNFKLPP